MDGKGFERDDLGAPRRTSFPHASDSPAATRRRCGSVTPSDSADDSTGAGAAATHRREHEYRMGRVLGRHRRQLIRRAGRVIARAGPAGRTPRLPKRDDETHWAKAASGPDPSRMSPIRTTFGRVGFGTSGRVARAPNYGWGGEVVGATGPTAIARAIFLVPIRARRLRSNRGDRASAASAAARSDRTDSAYRQGHTDTDSSDIDSTDYDQDRYGASPDMAAPIMAAPIMAAPIMAAPIIGR